VTVSYEVVGGREGEQSSDHCKVDGCVPQLDALHNHGHNVGDCAAVLRAPHFRGLSLDPCICNLEAIPRGSRGGGVTSLCRQPRAGSTILTTLQLQASFSGVSTWD